MNRRATYLKGALLLALVVALHHVSRARTLDLPTRRTTALARLRLVLEAIRGVDRAGMRPSQKQRRAAGGGACA